MTLNTDRLRIAIALTILKHKEPQESFTSHIFDLQSKFTSSTESLAFHGTSWRDYALKLERECADLKSQVNVSQTKLLALSNLAGTTDVRRALCSDSTSKKKRISNANTGKRHVVSNLTSTLTELVDEHCPTEREPATFFVALDDFAELASFHELPDFPMDIFFSTTRRVIHTASEVLHSILGTNPNLSRLELLHDLMQFVIETLLPLLPPSSESFGYLLFNQLSGRLLSPVIQSFFPLSMKSLGYLLEPTNTNPNCQDGPNLYVDRRPKLLEFFQGIVSCLFSASCSVAKNNPGDSFCQEASLMRDMLILETIRHLKGILSPISGDNDNSDGTERKAKGDVRIENKADLNSAAKLEKDHRVRRLAVKDAMWYLCSVFHILIGSRTPDMLSWAGNSDNNDPNRQHAGTENLTKYISRELFELVMETRLSDHEKSWLPFGVSQTPVDSLLGDVEEARRMTGNKRFETNYERNTRTFDRKTNYSRAEAVEGMTSIAEGNDMYHGLDDAERGMLLCVIERYVNEE